MTPSKASACPAALTGWREGEGISLPAISAATKISVRYLQAIERGQFESLPGGAIGLSYVRQYAQAIHYNVNHLVEHYLLVRSGESVTPPPPRRTWISRVWNLIRPAR